jgi:hypothetical protein
MDPVVLDRYPGLRGGLSGGKTAVFGRRRKTMKKYKGFTDEFDRLSKQAIWNGRLCCHGQEGGYILYSQDEWDRTAPSEMEADAQGNVSFRGRPTGEKLPRSVMEAATS